MRIGKNMKMWGPKDQIAETVSKKTFASMLLIKLSHWAQRPNIVVKAHILHVTNAGSNLSTTWSLEHCREWPKSPIPK